MTAGFAGPRSGMEPHDAAAGTNASPGQKGSSDEGSRAQHGRAVCAVLLVVAFVLGIASSATSGVQTLIPETGDNGLEWIADGAGAGDLFLVGAWLVILGGYLGMVALIGFYDALRDAGRVLILAPILGAIGLTLVTVSHLIPIALANELVPAYTEASGPTQESLVGTSRR